MCLEKAATNIRDSVYSCLFFVYEKRGKLIYYLNIGLIIEQAICDVVKTFIDRQRFDEVYENFHISITNQHPFAHMIIDNNARCSDLFPSVVITSQSDSKVPEMANVPPQVSAIGMTADDIDELLALPYRDLYKTNEDGSTEPIIRNGLPAKEKIPGWVMVTDSYSINILRNIANSRSTESESGMVYGLKVNNKRRDRISVEIWAENNQLKNELYEHLRIFLISSLDSLLHEKYPYFNINVLDNSVNGDRSSNFNFDFDAILSGSHLSFDVDYSVAQIIFDTELTNISKEIITEVKNHVKGY